MTTDPEEHIRTAAARRLTACGLAPGSGTILAAVSGGADSLCLLRTLLDLGYACAVFHLDHCVRDTACREDAAFVRDVTAEWGLPFHGCTRDIPAEALAGGYTLEEAGRIVRYDEAVAIARAQGYAAIATGHHADDQAETVLMRLVRGTGVQGLGGIPPARAVVSPEPDDAPPVLLVRPLIDCTRADIQAALKARGIAWQHDATNDGRQALRNRIRHDLLPALRRDYNPEIEAALVRLAEAARADNALLAQLANEAGQACMPTPGQIDRVAFGALDLALQRRVIAGYFEGFGIEGSFDRIETARLLIAEGATGAAYAVDGCLLYNNRAVTEVGPENAPDPYLPPMPLTIPGETRIHGRAYRTRLRPAADIGDPRQYCAPARQVFDAEAFMGDAAVRGRLEGDRFQPLGMQGEKKLKDWFIDRGLTRAQRAAQHLVVVDDAVVWVVGHAIDARAAVTPATRRVVEIEVVENADALE